MMRGPSTTTKWFPMVMVYYQQVSYGLDGSKDRCSAIRLAVLKRWELTKIFTIIDNNTLLTKYLRTNPTEH